MNIQRAARHESGHAAMHVWLRMENLDGISLIPDPHTQSWGRCKIRTTAVPDYPRWRLNARKELLYLMTGGQAELLYPRARKPGNSGDWQKALQLAGKLFPDCPERAHRSVLIAEQRARRLVCTTLRIPILKFAEVLEERGEIEGWEAQNILMRLLGVDDYWDGIPPIRRASYAGSGTVDLPSERLVRAG